MSGRSRLLSFGAAALAIVAGVLIGALLGGIAAEAISLSLASLGAIAIVSLAFLEVGLSEDRERAREQRSRAREAFRRLPRRRRRPR